MQEIILWASDPQIIHPSLEAIQAALQALHIQAVVTVNMEPPLISRNQLWDRLPVIEINGLRWSLAPGRAFTSAQVTRLLQKVLVESKGPENI
jgi:hypothetical protein